MIEMKYCKNNFYKCLKLYEFSVEFDTSKNQNMKNIRKIFKKNIITEKLNKKSIYKIVVEFFLNKKKKRKEKCGWNCSKNYFQEKKKKNRDR